MGAWYIFNRRHVDRNRYGLVLKVAIHLHKHYKLS